MSDKKEQILAQIRSRYESKYGSSDIMKQVITSEISKISKKKKINFEDLSELESKISSVSKTASLLTTHESTLPNKFLSPKNIRAKKYKIEPIRSIANSPLGEHPNSTNNSSGDKSPTSNFKHSANVSASNIVLPPISPTYLTPMELKILKSHGNHLKNSKFLLDSSVEENNESSIALSKSTNLSPIRKDNSADFRLPAGLKGQEREKRISQNIWKKIDELNMRKAKEEENKKAEKLRNKKQEWVEILNKQISDKKEKASLLKNKDILWSQKSVEIDLQLKIDEQEKEKMHKRKMQSLERENFAQIFAEKDEQKKRLAELKQKEAQQASQEMEEYLEKKKISEENHTRKKRNLIGGMVEDMNTKISKTKEKISKDQEEDEKITRNIIDKLKQNEEKSEEFLRGLKERARRMPDAELAKEKGYDNLRQYGQIGANEDSSQGLMKFLFADRHNEQARTQKKMVNQSLLQKSYEHQRSIRIDRNAEYKSYIGEQRDLWKKEEENINAREELTAKITKLKKQAQREELDAQREIDAGLKAQVVSSNDAWRNKSALKELQVIPEKHFGKTPYLKGL